MKSNQESVFRRAGPTRMMYGLGRSLPPALGMLVVWTMTALLVLLKPAVYRAAYSNLCHVMPPGTSRFRLRYVLVRLLYHRSKGYYDFFRNVGRGVRVTNVKPPVRISAQVHHYINAAVFSGRGLLILGTHTSNYDLWGCALAEYLPIPPVVLSLADPAPGLQFINDLRAQGRGVITPITPVSLRDAMRHLKTGGIVITGIDRPLEHGNDPVLLFGKTAMLPTGYIRIPLLTDCLVMTIACRYDGKAYHIVGNPPMEMVRTGDREQDSTVNLQRILAQVEDLIGQAPQEWMVFVPVWSESEPTCLEAYAQA